MGSPFLIRAALPATLLFAACATPPEAPPPPSLATTAEHFVGTVRTGPVPDPALAPSGPSEPLGPFEVRLRQTLVRESGPGEAVEVRHVFQRGGETILRTHATAGAGLLRTSEASGAGLELWEHDSVELLSAGTTIGWRTRIDPLGVPAMAAAWEELGLELSRGPDSGLEVALVFGEEHVVLAVAPELDGTPLSLFVPAPTVEAPRAGLRFELSLSSESSRTPEAHAAAIEAERAALELARQRALAQATQFGKGEGFRVRSEGALRALESRTLQRPALVFLARETGAVLTGELAMVGDDDTLAGYLSAVRERLDDSIPLDEPEAVGWFLDATAFGWIARTAEDQERTLSDEVVSLLLVHTGQLGRYPDLVEEVAATSPGLAQFDERVVAENRIFLEDAHPAARVRAFEWLRTRGVAPAGFDPLASRTERRAALAAAAEPQLEAPQ